MNDDAQPQYESKHRHNVSAYKKYTPPTYTQRDPFKEAKLVSEYMETEEYQKFVALVGEEIARKILTNSVLQAAKDTFQKWLIFEGSG